MPRTTSGHFANKCRFSLRRQRAADAELLRPLLEQRVRSLLLRPNQHPNRIRLPSSSSPAPAPCRLASGPARFIILDMIPTIKQRPSKSSLPRPRKRDQSKVGRYGGGKLGRHGGRRRGRTISPAGGAWGSEREATMGRGGGGEWCSRAERQFYKGSVWDTWAFSDRRMRPARALGRPVPGLGFRRLQLGRIERWGRCGGPEWAWAA